MLSDQIIHLDPKSITVARASRQRQRNLVIDDLIPSIKARGILNPIILADDNSLMAGERRLRTAIHLQMPTVPCRYYSTLDKAEAQLVELEENLRRLDLAWQDKALSFLTIHNIYKARSPAWTTDQTAGMVGYDPKWTARILALGELVAAGDKAIIEADSIGAAHTIMVRRSERQAASAITHLFEVERAAPTAQAPSQAVVGSNITPTAPRGQSTDLPPPAKAGAAPLFSIEQADFIEWAADYAGPRFNFLHVDFPYGVELNGMARQDRNEGEYDGGHDGLYWRLLSTLLAKQDSLILPSAHMLFWFSFNHYGATKLALENCGWRVNPTPLVWHKTDNKGIIGDPLRSPRHIYETAFICTRGDRHIVKPLADCYGCPTSKAEAIHTNEKPEPMLNHFFSMFVDEHSRVLDPTCGSGSSIRAAEALGAELALGLEINPEFAERAQSALTIARGMRRLAKSVSNAK